MTRVSTPSCLCLGNPGFSAASLQLLLKKSTACLPGSFSPTLLLLATAVQGRVLNPDAGCMTRRRGSASDPQHVPSVVREAEAFVAPS